MSDKWYAALANDGLSKDRRVGVIMHLALSYNLNCIG